MSTKFSDILFNDENRFCLFPLKDNDIYNIYRKSLSTYWVPSEIDLSQDQDDWNNKLNDDERFLIKNILGFFANSDGIVNENLALNFYKEVELSEARCFYGFQIMMENIHNEVYSQLINTYIDDTEEKKELFNSIETNPFIKKKAEWTFKWMDKDNASFIERLVAFAIVEGIFFSGSFCSIFWMAKRNLLPGLCESNKFISRDEGLHCEFAVLLYNKFEEKLEESRIHEIITEAVNLEKEFIVESFPCRLIGMNSELMSQYIEFVADRLLKQLGHSPIYNSTNPFDFMDMISLDVKENFFEKRVTTYQKASAIDYEDTDSDDF